MKKVFILFAFTLLMQSFRDSFEPLSIGSSLPSPTEKMKDFDGKSFCFNDVKKKNGLLVIFSCNTCPWVIKNQQVAKEIAAYALAKNLGVIVLNANEAQRNGDDAPEAMKAYAAEQGYNYPYVLDENAVMANRFGARVTPECYLFDKHDQLVYHGAINDNPKSPAEATRAHLQVAIDEMIQGSQVTVPTSKAMGCTIKRKS